MITVEDIQLLLLILIGGGIFIIVALDSYKKFAIKYNKFIALLFTCGQMLIVAIGLMIMAS
jgi:hypothetical protein